MDKIKIILDIANNHNSNVKKGKEIIKQHSEIIDYNPDIFEYYIKFQYRDLNGGFIHPDYKTDYSYNYIKRFSETKLSNDEFYELKHYAEEMGFKTIATPFCEKSVDVMLDHGYNEIKVASCSNKSWVLLEKIASTKLPVILSTAGISFEELDNVVMFFKNRNIDLTLMHCRSEYPTKYENLELNQIRLLKERYPENTIGFSTHEEPDNYQACIAAVGQGAKLFERHIDITCDTINKYSSTIEDINRWLLSIEGTIKMCGVENKRYTPSNKELESLYGLRRGMFAKRNIDAGEKLVSDDIFFALPLISDNQYSESDFSKYKEFITKDKINKNKPVLFQDILINDSREEVLSLVKGLSPIIKESKIALPDDVNLELSHHYGLSKFKEYGAAIIDIINTENYCKKYIIMNSNQFHPNHKHLRKIESFHILYGSMVCNLDGDDIELREGDLLTVETGQVHSFETEVGVIFEEISTQHFVNDSFYLDEKITNNKDRKTKITVKKDFFV